MTTRTGPDLPAGLTFHPDKGIVVKGIVARHLATHPLGPRPNRKGNSVAFNDLAGNTALTMYLSSIDPGGTKCGHRHFDETLMYFVEGHGWTEMRQDDDSKLTRIEWSGGDLMATPANAWHEHFNADSKKPARVLSFKNAAVLQQLIGHGEGVDLSKVRLRDRYDDEPDYFMRREVQTDGTVNVNFAASIVGDELPSPDPRHGTKVVVQRYAMGGQRSLQVAMIAIGPGGQVRPHRPVTEEAFLVLDGSGRTDIWDDDGHFRSVTWSAGDLISPPLHVWRQHVNTGPEESRCLHVRNAYAQCGFGETGFDLDAPVPTRFPSIVDAANGQPVSG